MKEDLFRKIYKDLFEIFPPETNDPRFSYTKRTWIFPNHLDIVIQFAGELAKKYEANAEICLLAALLHDAGLAYKRESADPTGHEERSVEYANKFLPQYGYDKKTKDSVIGCIRATELTVEPKTLEEKTVRTSDALAHILSVHYFAKVSFSPDWESGIQFLDNKVEKDWRKICFNEEREMVRPVYEYLNRIISQYRNKKPTPIS